MKLNELIKKLQELEPKVPYNTEVEIDTNEIEINEVVLNTDNDYDIILLR